MEKKTIGCFIGALRKAAEADIDWDEKRISNAKSRLRCDVGDRLDCGAYLHDGNIE